MPLPRPQRPRVQQSPGVLWAPASQPRAQCRLASLGESWALVWGQSGTKVLEKGQDTQSGMAMLAQRLPGDPHGHEGRQGSWTCPSNTNKS